MVERAFFSFRYALPGYTFVLVMLFVEYPNLDNLFSVVGITEDNAAIFTAFLTFFTVLSGGAIGFLVSQIWYYLHNSPFKAFYVRDTRNFLKEKYKLSTNVRNQLIFLDYIFHLSDRRTIEYVQRRLDLKHILGSTIFSFIFGAIFGLVFRLNIPLIETNLGVAIASLDLTSIISIVTYSIHGAIFVPCFFINPIISMILSLSLYDFSVICIISIFITILFLSFKVITREHSRMADVAVRKIVNSTEYQSWTPKDFFTEDYFEK